MCKGLDRDDMRSAVRRLSAMNQAQREECLYNWVQSGKLSLVDFRRLLGYIGRLEEVIL